MCRIRHSGQVRVKKRRSPGNRYKRSWVYQWLERLSIIKVDICLLWKVSLVYTKSHYNNRVFFMTRRLKRSWLSWLISSFLLLTEASLFCDFCMDFFRVVVCLIHIQRPLFKMIFIIGGMLRSSRTDAKCLLFLLAQCDFFESSFHFATRSQLCLFIIFRWISLY